MNTKTLSAAASSFVIAAILALAGLNVFEFSLGEPATSVVRIYPAAFFALLGLLLAFLAVKSSQVKRS